MRAVCTDYVMYGIGLVFEELMDTWTNADLSDRSMSYVIECCAWYIQFPVDPVYGMFTLALFRRWHAVGSF